MLPQEENPETFQVPRGVVIDNTNALVFEENQVDTVVFSNFDVRGELPSVGTLSSSHFTGMGMGENIYVQSSGPYSGIKYDSIEVLTFNLGDGVDDITVESTTEGIHIMNLGRGDDNVTVKSLSGPLIVNGNEGDDSVHVSSDESKLDLIHALLAFDGGNAGNDKFILDNSNDDSVDDVLTMSRLFVEVKSMVAPELDVESDLEKNPVLVS